MGERSGHDRISDDAGAAGRDGSVAEPSVRPRSGRCPTCEHEAGAVRTRIPVLFRRTRVPPPATCRVSDGVDDPSGWPTECGCTDPFHGS